MGTDKAASGHASGFHYEQVDTDIIHRSNDDHACDQAQRLDKIERRLDKHDAVLSDGRSEFTAIRKDIQHLTEAINNMRCQLEKVITAQVEAKVPVPVTQKIQDAAIFWLVPIIGGALLWAISASGQISRGIPHP